MHGTWFPARTADSIFRQMKAFRSPDGIIAAKSTAASVPVNANTENPFRDAAPTGHLPENFWRSLYFFCWYRLGVVLVFLGVTFFFGHAQGFGAEDHELFVNVTFAYLFLALLFFLILKQFRHSFNLQLTAQVITDIVVLTLLMYSSGGLKSGMAFMLLVVLAGAGLVGQGRLSLLFASIATLAILLEQAYRVLRLDAGSINFINSGVTSIGFFATSITSYFLARRVRTNEELARLRGIELADQMNINQRVIRDMQDGVLVVDAAGQVRQFNPQAALLLGADELASRPMLGDFSPLLAQHYARWGRQFSETTEDIQIPESNRLLRVRFLPAGDSGNALIFLEDMERVQAQAQQLKLAALGRLTANMAHEIRNPLSSISYAAELLAEEQRDDIRQRLTRIVSDNTQRLNRLISEVLELGRRDRAQPELLHLGAYVRTFLEEYAVHNKDVARIVALNMDESAMLNFDRSHLNRVLWNLLGNALRHCRGEAGSVRIDVRSVTTPLYVRRTELHVIDDGEGIDPELRTQVFEPFFTTHSSGTGLGLYIARELCEANNAQLEIRENSPGAHFCLTGEGGIHGQN